MSVIRDENSEPTFDMDQLARWGHIGLTYKINLTSIHPKIPRVAVLKDIDIPKTIPLDEKNKETLKELLTLSHPSLIPVYNYNLEGQRLKIITEYGETNLRDYLDRRILDLENIGNVARGIVSGIEFLHHRGFTHGKLKPRNVVLQGQNWKLTDGGLSNFVPCQENSDRSHSVTMDHCYGVPEDLVKGRTGTKESDMFSVGTIIYFLHENRLPFNEATLRQRKEQTPNMRRFESREMILESCDAVAGKAFKELRENLVNMLKWDPKSRPTSDDVVKLSFFQRPIKGKSSEEKPILVDVKNCPEWMPTLHDAYKMTEYPRGHVLIINIEDYKEHAKYRVGSFVDYRMLKALFDQLGFSIIYKENCNNIKNEVTDYAKMSRHGSADMAVVIILCHGTDKSLINADGSSVEVEEVLACLKSERLEGKPKLVLIQSCRSPSENQVAETRSAARFSNTGDAVSKDFMIGMSTKSLQVSYRHPLMGSVYINAIVEVFQHFAFNTDLKRMLELVNRRMEEHPQLPLPGGDILPRGFYKKLYFRPGRTHYQSRP